MSNPKFTITIVGMKEASASIKRLTRAVSMALTKSIKRGLADRRALIEFAKMLDARTKETEQWQKRLKKLQEKS